jgi:hypothetical protein
MKTVSFYLFLFKRKNGMEIEEETFFFVERARDHARDGRELACMRAYSVSHTYPFEYEIL